MGVATGQWITLSGQYYSFVRNVGPHNSPRELVQGEDLYGPVSVRFGKRVQLHSELPHMYK